MSNLRALMEEHSAAPFPESVETGEDYGSVNSVLIGADIYVSALQVSRGTPLTRRIRVAGEGKG